jgi:hypothetical protein
MRVGKYPGMRAAEKPSGTRSARSFLTGAAVGGAVAYLLDPARGRRRRRLLAERAAALGRSRSPSRERKDAREASSTGCGRRRRSRRTR